jgi:peptide/nickel transport system substrate-binding protein
MSRRVFGIVAGLALLLVACGRDKTEPSGGGSAGGGSAGGGGGGKGMKTFVYARGKDSPGLDPAEETDGEAALVLVNVYDTLVRFKPGSAETEAALATSWKAADDHLSMTFELRPGVVFHDGTPLDAAAVVANMERQRDPKHPLNFLHDRYAYWGDMFGFVKSCSAPAPMTVRFDFAEAMPPFFLSLLAMFSASIVSPKALAMGKEYVARHAVGTGAFRFRSWEKEEITLDANDDWWDGRPAIDRLVFVVVSNSGTASLKLESGQVDGIDNVATRDVPRIRKDARFTLQEVNPGLSVCYLSMNNDVKPFDDVRVRRAVALAIDKKRIVDAAYDNLATPIATLVPPSVPYSAPIPDRVRDVGQARKLLAEANAAGAKIRLQYPSNSRPYLPNPDAVAAQIRDDLREIGLEVELKKEEWSGYLKLTKHGEHQMCVLGWSPDVYDADNYLYVLLSKEGAVKGSANNVSFYRSDAFQERVAKARTSYDPDERRRLYAEAQQIAFDDAPMVPLIVQPRTSATAAYVKGFVMDPISSPRFARVTLSK